MANQSIKSMFALHNRQLVVAEGEHRNLDWEVVDAEDLYADVDSLESFSMSSGDEEDAQDQETEGVLSDQDEILGQSGDCTLAVHALGRDLEVTPSELHLGQGNREIDFGDGSFYSADSDTDSSEYDVDVDVVVGEPSGDVVPVVDPLGFRIGSGTFVLPCDDPHFDEQSIGKGDGNGADVQDDDGRSEYEIDVDDELVPWGVAGRLQTQRMRKLGKRPCSRMNKSKKMAHHYNKPACLHGKHGLGLKAY